MSYNCIHFLVWNYNILCYSPSKQITVRLHKISETIFSCNKIADYQDHQRNFRLLRSQITMKSITRKISCYMQNGKSIRCILCKYKKCPPQYGQSWGTMQRWRSCQYSWPIHYCAVPRAVCTHVLYTLAVTVQFSRRPIRVSHPSRGHHRWHTHHTHTTHTSHTQTKSNVELGFPD